MVTFCHKIFVTYYAPYLFNNIFNVLYHCTRPALFMITAKAPKLFNYVHYIYRVIDQYPATKIM